MNTFITIACPDCGSSIKKKLDVCEHCKRAIELNEELEKYKALVDAGMPAAEENVIKDHRKNIPLGFYAAGYMIVLIILLTLALKKDYNLSSFPLYQLIFFAAMPIIIYIGIVFVKEFNIWIFAILALLLPKIIVYIAVQLQIYAPIKALNSFGKAPFVFGLYVLIASLPFTVFLSKIQLKKIYGFKAIKEYITNTETAVDRAEKFVLIITAILAALKTITSIF